MNLEQNPKIEELRELIEACDDLAGHHVLWVAKNGDVHLSKVPKDQTPVGFQKAQPDMQLRFETFEAGNEYVGPEAAEDRGWIDELFESLMTEWSRAKNKPTVEYAGQF